MDVIEHDIKCIKCGKVMRTFLPLEEYICDECNKE